MDRCVRCGGDLDKAPPPIDNGCVCTKSHPLGASPKSTGFLTEHAYDGYGSFDTIRYKIDHRDC